MSRVVFLEAITSAENLIARFKKMDGPVGGKENEDIPEPYTLPENLEDIFPCLLVLAGSGNPILRVRRADLVEKLWTHYTGALLDSQPLTAFC